MFENKTYNISDEHTIRKVDKQMKYDVIIVGAIIIISGIVLFANSAEPIAN